MFQLCWKYDLSILQKSLEQRSGLSTKASEEAGQFEMIKNNEEGEKAGPAIARFCCIINAQTLSIICRIKKVM